MVWVFPLQKLRPWSEFLLSLVNTESGAVWVWVRVFLGPWSHMSEGGPLGSHQWHCLQAPRSTWGTIRPAWHSGVHGRLVGHSEGKRAERVPLGCSSRWRRKGWGIGAGRGHIGAQWVVGHGLVWKRGPARSETLGLSGLPNANAKLQRFSYAISQIATLPPVVALNRNSKSQIAAKHAAFGHAISQIALTAFLLCP